MFYTGASRETKGLSQRLGTATSRDLITWEKPKPPHLVLTADSRWYETLGEHEWRLLTLALSGPYDGKRVGYTYNLNGEDG